ncbi:uncharacterized protein LOC124888972 [Capsicum annuum]|uniref:uncharacterized protein LOC124888972 n=1 Tax=Capsicum annuum TaxID=4072 RepID=UPI001FB18905|nr:uncharacterized protein LOC124888972 [Capsicum annuum]
MKNFFKKVNYSQSSSSNVNRSCLITDLDLGSLKADPGEIRPISDYDPRIRDEVRKYYIEKGPCQPILKPYASSEIGGRIRQFASSWFKGSHSTWLEYSVEKDAAYCLFNSVHHKCYNKILDLSNRRQSIQVVLDKHFEKLKSENRIHLEASINVAKLLLYYKLPFRGHEESESSSNQGYFLGLLRWHGDNHPDVGKVILEKAPQNDTLTCPMIQKDIVNACAKETLKVIIADLNGDYFGILVDESKDISHKEQMALVLRYVDKKGEVVERFIDLVHVSDTSACSLKKEIYSLLSDHSLSPSKICGQGYDGAINMKGEINELLDIAKADIERLLIMSSQDLLLQENCSALSVELSIYAAAPDLPAERALALEKLKENLPYFSLTLGRAKKDQEDYYKKVANKVILVNKLTKDQELYSKLNDHNDKMIELVGVT